MFGTNDPTQTNDDPAMLDNVKDLASKPADQVVPDDSGSDPAQPAASSGGAQMFGAPTTPSEPQTQTAPSDDHIAVATPAPGFSSSPPPEPSTASPEPLVNSPEPESTQPTQTQDQPFNDTSSLSSDPPQIKTSSNPIDDSGASQTQTDSTATSDTPVIDVTDSNTADIDPADPSKLADLKKQALDHLEPLSDHIDGDTPEETFKRTMMMIQANDNHGLIEKALAAAKEISDDKARAQALLDIINEINYFSQNS